MKFTSEDLKVLFFDRKGKIYYNINWENNKEKFKWLNDIYGDYEDKQFMLILDKEVYNELTQFGRKKVLDTIDQIFIDYYVNCEVMSSFKVRFKEKVKELWFIFYYAIIKYKKINKLLDVERAQKMGIKYGLEFIKEIDEISERELGIKP